MKLLIVTSGGGHFSPALAVIQKLPVSIPFFIVGRKYALEADNTVSLEYRLSKERNFLFIPITTGRFQRIITPFTVFSLLKIPIGFFQALSIIKKHSPDCVISFGGYVSLPVVIASWIMQKPVVIHEQTLASGLSNKIASFFAGTVCVSWEESKKYFPKYKTILTGNPLREEIKNPHIEKSSGVYTFFQKNKKSKVIYITGGSIGSHAINTKVFDSLKELLKQYAVIHQVGDAVQYKDFELLTQEKSLLPESLQEKYYVHKFFTADEVGFILKEADVVVSRAGINIITELLFLRKKAVFIPLPYGQQNEQLKNAKFYERVANAIVLPQEKLTSDSLLEGIEHMLKKQIDKKGPYQLPTHPEQKIISVIESVISSS